MRGPTGNRLAGKEYTSSELAGLLNGQAAILRANEGGVTFSGGEPLAQADFIAEVIDQLETVHVLLDTSGYGPEAALRHLLARVDHVYYDLKLVDRDAHMRYTGQTNERILENLRVLGASGVPFVIRVPLIPGVTDADENLAGIADLARQMPGGAPVDLLPYNRAAGAKYAAAGRAFRPGYDENQPVKINLALFESAGVKVRVA